MHAPVAPMHGHQVRSQPDAADTAPHKGAQSLNCAVHVMEEKSAPPDSTVTHLDLFMHDLPKVRFLCSCRSVSAPFPMHITASLLACTRARQAGCLAHFPALRSLKLIQQVPHILLRRQPAHLR